MFTVLILLTIIVFLFSILDIYLNKNWIENILSSYILLFFSAIILIYLKSSKEHQLKESIKTFEKTLKGGLYHYKCPKCDGIFALKKSKENSKKPSFIITCPNCGFIGLINPSSQEFVHEKIPEKKSESIRFKCKKCGEWITLWAEGTELYRKICLFSCPFCGKEKTMKRI